MTLHPSQHSPLQGSAGVLLHAVCQGPRLTPLLFSGASKYSTGYLCIGQQTKNGGKLEDHAGGLRGCPEMGYTYHFCPNFITQSWVTWAYLITEKCSFAGSLGGK